jgi:hypothetical protein
MGSTAAPGLAESSFERLDTETAFASSRVRRRSSGT